MKTTIALVFATAALACAADQTFTGVITDSMCGADHKMMNISPDSKCVQECMKSGTVKYALLDGTKVYKLSDQKTPAQYAGAKVRVSGTLFPTTGIIEVKKIEPVK